MTEESAFGTKTSAVVKDWLNPNRKPGAVLIKTEVETLGPWAAFKKQEEERKKAISISTPYKFVSVPSVSEWNR